MVNNFSKNQCQPSVLIFRSAALGDFILAIPALAAARKTFVDHKIVLLTTTSASKVQRNKVAAYVEKEDELPWTKMATPHLIDETVVVHNLTSWNGINSARLMLKERQFKYALMFVDPAAPWVGRIKKWIMLKFIAGFSVPVLGWRGRGSLNGNRPRLHNEGILRHHVHGPMQFLGELSPKRTYTDEDINFDLRPDKGAEEWAIDWILQNGLKNQRLVALAPGSLHSHKQWPMRSFMELLECLVQEFSDIAFLVVGTKNDWQLGEELRCLNPERVFNVAGQTSVAQSSALLKRIALLIGNDGGAMHLGDAMGCKVVSIVSGIEYPDSIEPWHNKNLVVRFPVTCAPCYSFSSCPEGHRRCLTDLPVSLVLAKCRKVLSNN